MTLKLYNTLTRKKESVKPMDGKLIRMYSCGPTVYDFAHIGNFRAYVCVDILKRYMKFKGLEVFHVMNITDVEDKIIKSSKRENVSLKEFTQRYEKAFFEDLGTLNIDKADIFPKATEHIDGMVSIIKKLLDEGIAYKSEDGSIYYDISKFKDYGKLSHAKISGLKDGARVKQDSYEKEQANDFALWKSYDKEDGNVFWDTEMGKGRPGWHIECSAMSICHLGNTFDIHAGGIDLVFPHHENEIAQSEAFTGKKFAKLWFHNEHLMVDGKKMSKSLGNFYTLRDLLKKGYNAKAIRYLLLSANYRVQLNFTEEAVKASDAAVRRLTDFYIKLKEIKSDIENKNVSKLVSKAREEFEKAMDDDLSISDALSHVFDLVKEVNTLMMENKIGRKDASLVLKFVGDIDSVLGVLDKEEQNIDDGIQKLIDERENARKSKDFKLADKIRDDLKSRGIILEDTKEGIRWKKG